MSDTTTGFKCNLAREYRKWDQAERNCNRVAFPHIAFGSALITWHRRPNARRFRRWKRWRRECRRWNSKWQRKLHRGVASIQIGDISHPFEVSYGVSTYNGATLTRILSD